MAKRCDICGKGPMSGRTITRRGMAKSKGGVGKKVVRTSLKRFLPNLRKMRAIINGSTKTVVICMGCLKSGKVKKAV